MGWNTNFLSEPIIAVDCGWKPTIRLAGKVATLFYIFDDSMNIHDLYFERTMGSTLTKLHTQVGGLHYKDTISVEKLAHTIELDIIYSLNQLVRQPSPRNSSFD